MMVRYDHAELHLASHPYAGTMAARKEWAGGASTPRPVSTPTVDRSSYE